MPRPATPAEEPTAPIAGGENPSASQDAPAPASDDPGTSPGEPAREPEAVDRRIALGLRTVPPSEPAPEAPTAPAPTEGEPAQGGAPRDPERQSRLDRRIGELLSQTRQRDQRIAELEAKLAQQTAPAAPTGKAPDDGMPLPADFLSEETGHLDVDGYRAAMAAWVGTVVQKTTEQRVGEAVSQARQRELAQAAEQRFNVAEQAYRAATPEYERLVQETAGIFYEPQYALDPATRQYRVVGSVPRNQELIEAVAQRGDPRLAHRVMQDPGYWVALQGPDLQAALDAEVKTLAPVPPAGARTPTPTRTPPAPPPRPAAAPGGGPTGPSRWTEDKLRGQNPRQLVQHLNDIDDAINRGTFFRP